MPQTSFALMTNLGRAKEAAAFASATTVEITHIAIGDGATVPSGGETALYNQLALKTISGSGTVVGADNVAYFDCFLEAAEGPYTIREAGLYDVDGDLIAIAHYDPPINKPIPASGQTVEGTVRLEVAFSNVANITISIDPSLQVALQRLTRLPWIPIISMSLATPPASPVAGDTYLIAASPTGSWSGHAGKIAEYTTAGWAIITPPEGHGVSLPDGRVFEKVSGTYVEKLALDTQSGKWVYAADSGTANALVATLAPVPTAYVAGMALRIKAANSNTSAATLNVNGLGAKPIVRADGVTALYAGEIVGGSVQEYVYDGTSFQLMGTRGRPPLSSNRTVYINNTTGSDTLYDGSSATVSGSQGPFKTLTKALSTMAAHNLNGYDFYIMVADGTYTTASQVSLPIPNGSGSVYIIGNQANPSLAVIYNSGTGSVLTGGGGVYNLKGLYIEGTSGGHGIWSSGSSVIWCADISFGPCPGGAHFACDAGAFLGINGTVRIFGSAQMHLYAVANGTIVPSAVPQPDLGVQTSVTFTTFAVSIGSYVSVDYGSVTYDVGVTVTGQRYSATLGGVINAAGHGATWLPGSIAGSTATGGQYA